MADKNYLTVAKAAVDEFTEKRSRFIGAIQPVTTEEEAQAFIKAKQKEFWDAKHNVYAYVLDVLRKEGLTDCVVVVTRYFGGILLGGGGLVRAYSHGAKIAVDAGGVVEMRRCLLGEIVCDYSQYGIIPAILADCGATLTDTAFGEAVTVSFSIPREGQGSLEATVIDRSNGRLSAVFTGEEWVPCPVERHKG